MSTKLEIRNERINQVLFYGGLVGLAISVIAMAIDKDVFGQTMALDDKNTDMQVWTELKKQAEPLRIALSEAINCYPDTKCDLIFAGHGFIQISYADGYEDSYTENFIGMGQAQDIVNNFVKTYGWLDKDTSTDSDIYLNIDYDADSQKASDNKNNDNDNKNSASNDNDDNDSKDDNDNNDSYPECEGFTGNGICHDSSDEGPQEGTTTQDNDNEDNDVKDSDNQENQDSEDNKDDSETEQEDNEVEQEDNEESDNNEVSEEQ